MQGICDRDRSVRAGRSHFLIAYPSLYILLGNCQDVVGHLEQDFDTGAHLSCIFLYFTEILFHLYLLYPIATFYIHVQSI